MREEAADGLSVLAIEVNRVSERLEAVEGDAQWERPVPLRDCYARETGIGLQEEGHVLERDQDAEVQQDAGHHQQPSYCLSLGGAETQPNSVVDKGSRRDEGQIKQAPFRVEEVVCEEQNRQRSGAETRQRPVEKKDRDQENEIERAGEDHAMPAGAEGAPKL